MAIFCFGSLHFLGVSLLFLGFSTKLSSQTTPTTDNMLEDSLDFLSRGYDPTTQLLDDLWSTNRKSTWKRPIFNFAKTPRNNFHDPATKQDLKIPDFLKLSPVKSNANVVFNATIYQTLYDLLPLMSLSPPKARMDSSTFEFQLCSTTKATDSFAGGESIIEFREIDLANNATDISQFDTKFLEEFNSLLSNGKPNDTELTQYFDFISKYGLYYFSDGSLGGVAVQQWILYLPLAKEKSKLEEDLKTHLKDYWIDGKVSAPMNKSNEWEYDYYYFGGKFRNLSKPFDYQNSIKFNRTLATGTLKKITDLGFVQQHFNTPQNVAKFKILVENLKKTEDRLAARYVIKRWKEGMKVAEHSWFNSTAVGLNNPKMVNQYLTELEKKKHLTLNDPLFKLVTEMAHYPVKYLIAMNGSLKK